MGFHFAVIVFKFRWCRCAEGLRHLARKPEIRRLIFGNSYPDGGSSDAGSGMLRKVIIIIMCSVKDKINTENLSISSQNTKLVCPLSIMPLTSITGKETNLAELQANGHICSWEMDTQSTQISVYRAVLAGDGSLVNCGSFLAYYSTTAKVRSIWACVVK